MKLMSELLSMHEAADPAFNGNDTEYYSLPDDGSIVVMYDPEFDIWRAICHDKNGEVGDYEDFQGNSEKSKKAAHAWAVSHGGKKSVGEAKKAKCTCDKDEATCKVHGKLAESEEYGDSGDFTDDWLDAKAAFEKALKFVESEKVRKWMELTDKNYGTSCQDAMGEIYAGMKDAESGWHRLDDEIDQADNG